MGNDKRDYGNSEEEMVKETLRLKKEYCKEILNRKCDDCSSIDCWNNNEYEFYAKGQVN